MTMLDVYVGRVDDPEFQASRNTANGGVPKRLSPFFPGSHAQRELMMRVKDDRLAGSQTDWAGWVVPMTKTQILDFVLEIYDQDYLRAGATPAPHLKRDLDELLAFIAGMVDDGKWALVRVEF